MTAKNRDIFLNWFADKQDHGCFFHGCPTCHARGDRVKHPRTGQSMSELYALAIKKEASLKKLGYKYICN